MTHDQCNDKRILFQFVEHRGCQWVYRLTKGIELCVQIQKCQLKNCGSGDSIQIDEKKL